MIAWISILIPPLAVTLFEMEITKEKKEFRKQLVEYLFNILLVNMFSIFVLNYIFKNRGNLVYNLNNYSDFAFKYMVLALLFSVLIIYSDYMCHNKKIIVNFSKFRWRGIRGGKLIAWIYAIILFGMNLIRIFDGNFWGDEIYTINLIKQPIGDIVSTTALDVHPPLYYFIVRLFYLILGNHDWIFHFVSLIPCLILIIFAMTVIWKKIAPEASLILITLLCLSDNAVTYNMEVRMYSWAALFILFSFYELYRVLQKNNTINYILFVTFSLAGAYTHYYALVSIAFLYIFIIVGALLKKLNIKKVALSCVATIVLYLPWLGYLLKAVEDRADNYWITYIPTFKESIDYLFSYQISSGLWLVIVGILLIAVVYETGMVKIYTAKHCKMNIVFSTDNIKCSNSFLWIIAGLSSILGTIIFAIAISNIIRPFYVLRYIYPVSIIAWMILGVSVSKLKGSKIYTAIILGCMLITFLPSYEMKYINEKNANNVFRETLQETENRIDSNDIILTDVERVNWTFSIYYYPDTETQIINDNVIPNLQKSKKYWLIINNIEDINIFANQLNKQGFFCKNVVDDGILGDMPVDIYSIETK